MSSETPTPRTDAEFLAHGISNRGLTKAVHIDFARTLERELAAVTKEREEARKWKDEDPRMLREQIRVADVAFNGLNERYESLRAENEALRMVARGLAKALRDERHCLFLCDKEAIAAFDELEKTYGV